MSENVLFCCQSCRARLNFTGNVEQLVEARTSSANAVRQSTVLQASVYDNTKIDESFIVLDDKRTPGMSNRGLEESFVVLGSASLLRPSPSGGSSGGSQQQQTDGSTGLDAKLQAIAHLFELASTQTRVDHPLCLDCAAQLKDEIDAQLSETEREIAAYSQALARLEAEAPTPTTPDQFQADMAQAEQREATARQQVEELEAELANVQRQLSALQAESSEIDSLEDRYWHEYNDYQYQLRVHYEERDALLAKIDRASQRLQLLKSTNVYNDAFKIWHDGAFGTISGFRLGRTTEVHVEWDEINAAWGQAVLLLHTIMQSSKLELSAYTLLPMGSHPRVVDKRGTYDLFGPVNKLWSASYDRAMVCYLQCLREFGEHARSRDVAEGREPAFEFPFPIDGDKVGAHTIKLTLNKDNKWTKALKLMLADLKVALQWMVKRDAAELPQLPTLRPEGPSTLSSSGMVR